MSAALRHFLTCETGTVTVDWTVLSAAAVSMSLATVAVLEGGIEGLISRVDSELRTQQISDSFVTFLSGHYEAALEEDLFNTDDGSYYFDYANTLMNHEILQSLETGIQLMEDGELTLEELPLLISLGSVAYQRNIADDDELNHYFGFDGSDPAYMLYF